MSNTSVPSPFVPSDDDPYKTVLDPSKRIEFGDSPAVIVVDLQRYATDPDSPLYCESARAILLAVQRLLEEARRNGVPVVHVTNVFHAGQEEAECAIYLRKLTSFAVFSEASEWSQIAPEIAPARGEVVIRKQMSSGFFQTNLARILTTKKIDTTIIAGFATSGCLRATAVDALFHGFRPILPVECIADRSPAAHQQNLLDMGRRYADVLPLDEVLEYLQTRAQTAVPSH